MQQIVKFLSDYEIIVYLVIGIASVFAIRKLVLAINESKNSVFGLEKEFAQKKVATSVTFIVLLGLLPHFLPLNFHRK